MLSPLLLVIALAVKLSSRGPTIYRSVRPGIGGKPFACFKFRTMREHSDQLQNDLESLNEQTGALFKIRDDPRLTRVGRCCAAYSLDELPQLVNVIRGEMSLVGPRPLPMRDYERLEEWHKKRYLVLPGITGLWQVSGRSELDFDDLVRLDFLYLEQWSIFLDLSILLKTIPRCLFPARRLLSAVRVGCARDAADRSFRDQFRRRAAAGFAPVWSLGRHAARALPRRLPGDRQRGRGPRRARRDQVVP